MGYIYGRTALYCAAIWSLREHDYIAHSCAVPRPQALLAESSLSCLQELQQLRIFWSHIPDVATISPRRSEDPSKGIGSHKPLRLQYFGPNTLTFGQLDPFFRYLNMTMTLTVVDGNSGQCIRKPNSGVGRYTNLGTWMSRLL